MGPRAAPRVSGQQARPVSDPLNGPELRARSSAPDGVTATVHDMIQPDGGVDVGRLGTELGALVSEVTTFDAYAAARLASLKAEVENEGLVPRWAGLDVIRAVDPPGIATDLRGSILTNRMLGNLERWRNLIVLCPIFLTWLGLLYASVGYHAAVTTDPLLVTRPFVLLWEEGFRGLTPWPWSMLNFLTLSTVATGDAGLLGVLLFMTWRIHTEINVKQSQAESRAQLLQQRLHHAAWLASLVLVQRTAPQSIAGELRVVTEGLLDELTAERERLEEIRTEREKEIAGLQEFSANLRVGASNLARAGDRIDAGVQALMHLEAQLDQRIATLAERDQAIEGAALALHRVQDADTQARRETLQQLSDAARLLGSSAERTGQLAATFSQQTRGLAQGLEQLVTQLGEQVTRTREAAAASDRSSQQLGNVVDYSARTIGEAVSRSTASMVKSVDESASGLLEAAQAIGRGSANMQSTTAALENVTRQIGSISPRFDAIVQEQRSAAGVLASSAREIADAARGLEEPSAEAANAMAHAARDLQRAVADLDQLVQATAALERVPAIVTHLERLSDLRDEQRHWWPWPPRRPTRDGS